MADILFTNFAYSQLAVGISAVATTLTVTTTHGGRFPAPTGPEYFYLVLEDAVGNYEIVRVTARAGDVMTVVRGQDNTVGRAWNAGDVVALRMVAAALQDAIAAAAGGSFAPLSGAAFTGSVSTTGTLAVTGASTLTGVVAANGGVDVPAGQTGTRAPRAEEVVGQTSSTGAAVLPSGTTAERPGTPLAKHVRYNTTHGMYEGYDGVRWTLLGRKALTRYLTTSGTTFSWAGLPDAMSAFRITLEDVSNTGGNNYLVRLGPVAGVLTTGYFTFAHLITSGGTSSVTSGVTNGVALMPNSAGSALTGHLFGELTDAATNQWVLSGEFTTAGGSTRSFGRIALGAGNPLSVVELLRTSTDTFDAGAAQLAITG